MGQNGPKPCFPISVDVIRGAKEFPQWIPAPDRPCHCDLILTQKSPVFEAPVFMTEHGDGQNCFKPAWYMSIEDAGATDS